MRQVNIIILRYPRGIKGVSSKPLYRRVRVVNGKVDLVGWPYNRKYKAQKAYYPPAI